VDQPGLDQDVQHAVDRDRRDAPLASQALDEVIGPERPLGPRQLLQHSSPERRQLHAILPADRLGVAHEAGSVAMVMVVMMAFGHEGPGEDASQERERGA
jgi:hypothetical protein